MTPTDWGAIIGKLIDAVPQAALALLFGIFAIVLLVIMFTFMERRDKEWRTFLSESQQRATDGQKDLAARLGDGMKELTVQIGGIATLMTQHDTATRIAQAAAQAQHDTLQARRFPTTGD